MKILFIDWFIDINSKKLFIKNVKILRIWLLIWKIKDMKNLEV